jgi:hypothetical protein
MMARSLTGSPAASASASPRSFPVGIESAKIAAKASRSLRAASSTSGAAPGAAVHEASARQRCTRGAAFARPHVSSHRKKSAALTSAKAASPPMSGSQKKKSTLEGVPSSRKARQAEGLGVGGSVGWRRGAQQMARRPCTAAAATAGSGSVCACASVVTVTAVLSTPAAVAAAAAAAACARVGGGEESVTDPRPSMTAWAETRAGGTAVAMPVMESHVPDSAPGGRASGRARTVRPTF